MHEIFSYDSFSYIMWWILFDFQDNLTAVKIEVRDIFRPVRRISIFCISKKKYFWFFAKHIHKNGENVLGNKILFEKEIRKRNYHWKISKCRDEMWQRSYMIIFQTKNVLVKNDPIFLISNRYVKHSIIFCSLCYNLCI